MKLLDSVRERTRDIFWALAFLAAAPALAAGGEVAVTAPPDAGWPRRADKIIRNAENDFTIDPDGHNRYVMVEIVNSGPNTEAVTLRGFINNFRSRAGLANRTHDEDLYLYIQRPGDHWRREYAQGRATTFPFGPWIVTAPPGRTRVCTVVGFTYQDYIDYVDSLPEKDARITKQVIASSGQGRFKTDRVRITNPASTNKEKLRIAMCKTTHAYEKSGFFMAQGAVAWLLSGDPAANLEHIEWTIYPCLDPQSTHDGCDYIENHAMIMDGGRIRGDTRTRNGLWDPETGEIALQRYHVFTDIHMFEHRDYESYKYNDPFAAPGPAGNGKSRVDADLLAFWPYWFEFGIDHYDRENKWPPPLTRPLTGSAARGVPQSHNARPEDFGGALVTHLELPFYGKDDIDPRERLREQGRMWARSHSQAYLRMQRDRKYWTTTSPGGPVDVSRAIILPVPRITLVEDLTPAAGSARSRANARGGPMYLYREDYQHGIGMLANTHVTYALPTGANTFRAMAGVDDAEPDGAAAVRFVALVDGREVWSSRPLRRGDREMAFFSVAGGASLTLRADDPGGTLANWGGAKLTVDDPEKPAGETAGGIRRR